MDEDPCFTCETWERKYNKLQREAKRYQTEYESCQGEFQELEMKFVAVQEQHRLSQYEAKQKQNDMQHEIDLLIFERSQWSREMRQQSQVTNKTDITNIADQILHHTISTQTVHTGLDKATQTDETLASTNARLDSPIQQAIQQAIQQDPGPEAAIPISMDLARMIHQVRTRHDTEIGIQKVDIDIHWKMSRLTRLTHLSTSDPNDRIDPSLIQSLKSKMLTYIQTYVMQILDPFFSKN